MFDTLKNPQYWLFLFAANSVIALLYACYAAHYSIVLQKLVYAGQFCALFYMFGGVKECQKVLKQFAKRFTKNVG